jgi:hypothetical protein
VADKLKVTANKEHGLRPAKIINVAVLLAWNMAVAQTIPDIPPVQTPDWAVNNRFVELFAGQNRQDYLEADAQFCWRQGLICLLCKDVDQGQSYVFRRSNRD